MKSMVKVVIFQIKVVIFIYQLLVYIYYNNWYKKHIPECKLCQYRYLRDRFFYHKCI